MIFEFQWLQEVEKAANGPSAHMFHATLGRGTHSMITAVPSSFSSVCFVSTRACGMHTSKYAWLHMWVCKRVQEHVDGNTLFICGGLKCTPGVFLAHNQLCDLEFLAESGNDQFHLV